MPTIKKEWRKYNTYDFEMSEVTHILSIFPNQERKKYCLTYELYLMIKYW
jgi:hypothetical protein